MVETHLPKGFIIPPAPEKSVRGWLSEQEGGREGGREREGVKATSMEPLNQDTLIQDTPEMRTLQ